MLNFEYNRIFPFLIFYAFHRVVWIAVYRSNCAIRLYFQMELSRNALESRAHNLERIRLIFWFHISVVHALCWVYFFHTQCSRLNVWFRTMHHTQLRRRHLLWGFKQRNVVQLATCLHFDRWRVTLLCLVISIKVRSINKDFCILVSKCLFSENMYLVWFTLA